MQRSAYKPALNCRYRNAVTLGREKKKKNNKKKKHEADSETRSRRQQKISDVSTGVETK